MNGLAKYYLKWVTAESFDSTSELKAVNHVLVGAFSKRDIAKKNLIGFCLLPESALNDKLVSKFNQRMSESLDLNFFAIANEKAIKQMKVLSQALTRDIEMIESPFVAIAKDGHLRLRHHINVINVDDSKVILTVFKKILSQISFVNLTTQINDSSQAFDIINKQNPDLVTLDIQMPVVNGVQLARSLRAIHPTPLLMISSMGVDDGPEVIDSLVAGAFDFLPKPKLEEQTQFGEVLSERILAAVHSETLGAVSVAPTKAPSTSSATPKIKSPVSRTTIASNNVLWCIGSSTGGPKALTQILNELPEQIPPLVIVQHIPANFSKALAESLNRSCRFPVKEIEDRDELQQNFAYIAPGGKNIRLVQQQGKWIFRVETANSKDMVLPNIDVFFKSVAEFKNFRVVAGILTGMGQDGAEGLLELLKMNATTFAQDENTSVVYGMPKAAVKLGGTDTILALPKIADFLIKTQSSSQAKKTG
jgi:two-component system, chemotaxis family, protein-glutamate methylesterase/glutaminase